MDVCRHVSVGSIPSFAIPFCLPFHCHLFYLSLLYLFLFLHCILLFFAMFCLRSNDWLGQLNRWFCAARLRSLRKPLPACFACQTSFAFVTRLRIPVRFAP